MDAVRLPDPGVPARRSGWAPGAAGLGLIFLGGAVLAGWLTGRTELVRLQPGFAAMQANTAACFVLTGAALLALAFRVRRLAPVLGALTALLAGLTFLEYLFGLDLGIDGLLPPRFAADSAIASGRMAADTALALLAAGIGLLGFRRLPTAVGFLATLVLTVGGAWAVGYPLGIPAVLASDPAATQMALHTALGLVLLGSTLLGLSLERQRSARQPLPWLPLVLGAGLTLATLVLWRALETRALVELASGPRSALSEVVLGAGLTISLLLTLTLHYGDLAARRAESFEREVRRRTGELEDALARLRAENRDRHWTEVTLRRTLDVGRLVSAELDPERAVQAVTDAATELIGAAFGAFFYNWTDDAGETYMLWALAGAPRESFEGLPLPRAESLLGRTLRGEGPIRLDDVTRDPRFGHNPPHHGLPEGHLPVVSYLAVPVVSRSGQPFGGLFFGHPQAGVFTAREEEIVVGLAAQAAIAVDNARLYQEERRSRAEAQEANAAKDRFLIVMGHELRNPLGSITSALEVLGSGGEDPERDAQMHRIARRQVSHLARLVEDLLDISRIEQGKVALRKGRLDLGELFGRRSSPTARRRRRRASPSPSTSPPTRSGWTPTGRGWSRCSRTSCRTASSSPTRGARSSAAWSATARRRCSWCATPGAVSSRGSSSASSSPSPSSKRPSGGCRAAWVSACPSSRAWWRPTAAASRPRAPAPARAPRSGSGCRSPVPRPAPPRRVAGARAACPYGCW